MNILGGDLNETAPAKFTAAGQIFASTAANAGAARTPNSNSVLAAEQTTSLSFVDLATVGPTVTLAHGATCLMMWQTQLQNTAVAGRSVVGIDVSGSHTLPAQSSLATMFQSSTSNNECQVATAFLLVAMTQGTSTFRLKYLVTTGTGTFTYRRLSVVPF